jgi:hypothetical protein
MRSIQVLVLLLLLLTACRSPEKLLQKGDYDSVIERITKKTVRGRADKDDKLLLDKAYRLANQYDLQRIKFLKTENNPENWEEIYKRYNALSRRQAEIQKVTPLNVGNRVITYDYTDYTKEIVEAKANVARFYYEKGLNNMKLQSKEGYRQAYYDFQKVHQYRVADYHDVNDLIEDAKFFGTTRVLLLAVNTSGVRLPNEFYDNIVNINLSGLNTMWVEYYLNDHSRDIQYDYFITVELHHIVVTPDGISRREYVRTKEMQDGFEYELDRRGNVKKDSLGNNIKIPKFKRLSCKVIETRQFKSVTIKGMVKFRPGSSRNTYKSEPVAATSVFEHFSARAYGDLEALEATDRQLLRNEVAPFPDDLSMIYDCTETLKQAIHDVIYDNRRLIN